MPQTQMEAITAPSARTRIRRIAELATYDRDTLHSIIDAAYVCHVAVSDEQGTHCLPTACWRIGEFLYIHGSNGGRLMRLLVSRVQVCVAITHADGLVLARLAFNHSLNYRSAVIYGHPCSQDFAGGGCSQGASGATGGRCVRYGPAGLDCCLLRGTLSPVAGSGRVASVQD